MHKRKQGEVVELRSIFGENLSYIIYKRCNSVVLLLFLVYSHTKEPGTTFKNLSFLSN